MARRLAWPGGVDRGTLPALEVPVAGVFAVDGGRRVVLVGDDAPAVARVRGVEVASTVALVDLDPDGGAPRPARVWTLDDGYAWMPESRAGPSRAVTSPDGRTLALVGHGLDVRLLALATAGEGGVRSHAHEWGAFDVAWSPDGRQVLTGGSDRTARILDAASGAEVLVARGHAAAVGAVAFAPDGLRFATAGFDRTVRVFDARTGELLESHRTEAGGRPWTLRFLPEGDGLRLDAAGGFEVWGLGDDPGAVVLRGHRTRAEGNPLPYVYDVAWAPDGLRLVSAGWDRTARVWDATTGDLLVTLDASAPVWSVDWSRDGERIALATRHGDVSLFDAATGARIARHDAVRTGEMVGRCRFLPSGDELLVAQHRAVLRLDGRDLTVRGPVAPPSSVVTALAPDPAGRRVAVGGRGGEVSVVAGGGAPTWARAVGSGPIGSVEFAPDGRRLLVASHDGFIVVFDAADGREVLRVESNAGPVYAARWSPDGRRVVTGSRDGTIRVLDATEGADLGRLRGHGAYIHGLAFTADGESLASGSGDNTVRVWGSRSPADRYARALAARAAEAAVEPRVRTLLATLPSPRAVHDAMAADATLSADARHAAGNVLLRLVAAGR